MKHLQYVLDNLIEKRLCPLCNGWWFLFNHGEDKAYYRLSPLAPQDCPRCKPIDEEIESGALVSIEHWVAIE